MSTEIRPSALLALALVFFGTAIAKRLPVSDRFRRETIEPLCIAIIGAVAQWFWRRMSRPMTVSIIARCPHEAIEYWQDLSTGEFADLDLAGDRPNARARS